MKGPVARRIGSQVEGYLAARLDVHGVCAAWSPLPVTSSKK